MVAAYVVLGNTGPMGKSLPRAKDGPGQVPPLPYKPLFTQNIIVGEMTASDAQAHREPQQCMGKHCHGAPLCRKFAIFFLNGTF